MRDWGLVVLVALCGLALLLVGVWMTMTLLGV